MSATVREILIGEGVLRPASVTGEPLSRSVKTREPVLRLDEAGKQAAARHMKQKSVLSRCTQEDTELVDLLKQYHNRKAS